MEGERWDRRQPGPGRRPGGAAHPARKGDDGSERSLRQGGGGERGIAWRDRRGDGQRPGGYNRAEGHAFDPAFVVEV